MSSPTHVRSRSTRELRAEIRQLADRLEMVLDPAGLAGLRGEPEELAVALGAVVDTLLSNPSGTGTQHVETMRTDALALLDDWSQHLERWRATAEEQVADGLSELRGCKDLSEAIDRLCPEAVRTFDVKRALIARLDDDSWSAWRGYEAAPGAGSLTWTNAASVRLSNLPVERAVLQERRVTAHAARAPHHELPAVFRSVAESPHVIAPVCVTGDVRALLYLQGPTRALTSSAGFAERTQRFAAGVGRILERELLYDRFRAQRVRMRASLSGMERIMSSLDTGVDLVRLVGRAQADTVSAVELPLDELSSSWDRVLTARERDVMGLLVLGHDNAEIALQLAIAPSTVKSHVRGVMRKLGAVNRTELISRYHGAADDPRWHRGRTREANLP